ncbi:protein delta homolog 2 isoform X2 [Spea bombifrons]|uniref:protein delta homolog 2 isoform X2 n=1 Tax=Spea bombifrons TaxID=233779 RepID=UPI00234BA294|nr:protein delta homolog 2 isoform X2 [Spea bombifrons]XP_053316041.1 protein delta homolog 2 isoform X2 [Spea bombifrons]
MLCWPRLLLPALCWVLFAPQTSAQADECSERCDLYHGHCDEEGVCRCDPGWHGRFCEDCVRMPGCAHGSCHQPWQCMCHPGWAGKFCDKDLLICDQANPCQNGAECVSEPDGEHSCICPEPFRGTNCELKRGPCDTAGSPCLNGGTCQDDGGFADTFACRCLAGYVGRFCEVDVDDCLMRPCANGATCHDGINRFSCECPLGFQGRFCTVNINDCASRPCHNGGRCYDRVGDYECYCPKGFIGKSCEIPLPEPTWANDQATSRRDQTTAPPPAGFSQPARNPPASPQPGAGNFKISVFTQKEPRLSTRQMVIVAVFGGLTAFLVLITATVLLWYRNRGSGSMGCCRETVPATKTHYHECQDSRKTTEL